MYDQKIAISTGQISDNAKYDISIRNMLATILPYYISYEPMEYKEDSQTVLFTQSVHFSEYVLNHEIGKREKVPTKSCSQVADILNKNRSVSPICLDLIDVIKTYDCYFGGRKIYQIVEYFCEPRESWTPDPIMHSAEHIKLWVPIRYFSYVLRDIKIKLEKNKIKYTIPRMENMLMIEFKHDLKFGFFIQPFKDYINPICYNTEFNSVANHCRAIKALDA